MTEMFRLEFRIPQILILTACLLAISCRKDSMQEDSGTCAVLSAHTVTIDNEYAYEWADSDGLGIFMVQEGTSDVVGGYANRMYQAALSTGTVNLVPSGEPMYFPKDGSIVDFIAYSPFQDFSEGYVIAADLGSQNAPEPPMLLYSRASGHNSVRNTVRFTLRPEYAMLKVNLKVAGTKAAGDVGVTVCGCPVKGEFDVLAGSFRPFAAAGSTEMRRRDGNVNAYEALLLPHDPDASEKLEVSLAESEIHEIPLEEFIPEFEGGNRYDLDVTVSPDGVNAVLVGVSAYYISDWKDDSEDVTGEIRN